MIIIIIKMFNKAGGEIQIKKNTSEVLCEKELKEHNMHSAGMKIIPEERCFEWSSSEEGNHSQSCVYPRY